MVELDLNIKDTITMQNALKEDKFFSPYATRNSEAMYENISFNDSNKPTFANDINKIINSRAYNRYMGKTQVFSIGKRNDQVCTRALHVQLVSFIARRICTMLGLNADLAEAIALGHDLGHTPYGHDGERALNKILNPKGRYFRHAAHSVRILKEILKLDISIQVLDGIMCHNGESINYEYNFLEAKKKTSEDFLKEFSVSTTDINFEKNLRSMTMEGWCVRISDVIAYIGKDIEDAILLKFITRDDIPKNVVKILGNTNDQIVESLINDVVNSSYGKPFITFSKEVTEAILQLREFNYSRIYNNSFVKSDTFRIQNMFEILFDKYLRDLQNENKESSIFNFIDDKMKFNTNYEDIVIDYIAGMTDEFFEKEFNDFVMPTQVKLNDIS